MCFLLHDPHTVGPYVTDGSITFVKKSNYFRGRNRMRRSKLNLGAKDFSTFAEWSDQDNLLSTYTPRGLSEVVHFMMYVVAKSKSLDKASK